jgi:hypothetical protein
MAPSNPLLPSICFALIALAPAAQALDIPIHEDAAAELLDSKTCYATVSHAGALIGYELASSFIGSDKGKLLTLEADGNFSVGDRKKRRYAGTAVSIEITPGSSKKTPGQDEVSYIIRERGAAVITENGKARRLAVDVVLNCSP